MAEEPGTGVEKVDTNEGSKLVVAAKPLNQTQSKNLREIVTMDFRDLAGEVSLTITKQYQSRLKQIEAEYGSDTELEQAQRDAHVLLAGWRDEAETFRARLAERGIKISGNSTGGLFSFTSNASSLTRSGHSEAKARANSAKDRLQAVATQVINTHKTAAERGILMATLSGSASEGLIDSIPTATALMEAVMDRLSEGEMDDIKELMGTTVGKVLPADEEEDITDAEIVV